MHRTLQTLFIALILVGCQKKDYSPDSCLPKRKQDIAMRQAVRYSAKLPPQATFATRFDHAFDDYYDVALSEYDFRACALDPRDSSYYFLMTRVARSIWPAREAIGGKFKLDKFNNLAYYEEMFRTWKMAEDTLGPRATELFELMVEGRDLTPYTSKFKGDRYIEFPDDRFSFDVDQRRWRDAELDTLKIN